MAVELLAAVFLVTLPFGVWRATTRKLSLSWFLAIHVPIPFIFLARIEAGYSYRFIPFTVSACLAGQLVGGRIGAAVFRRRELATERPTYTTAAVTAETPAAASPASDDRAETPAESTGPAVSTTPHALSRPAAPAVGTRQAP